jgi:RNA polymerase sigma-70 factor (ECF subfamily)
MVAAWCGRAGVTGQDADDISQEVFQAVITSLESFRRDKVGDTFRGWLRGITRFKVLDHFRRRQGQAEAEGGTDARRKLEQIASEGWSEEEDSPEDLKSLYWRALELVRGEFEERTWQAFWRAAVDNQAVNDIALDMGVTPSAVRKAKSRVLHRLRQELGDLVD